MLIILRPLLLITIAKRVLLSFLFINAKTLYKYIYLALLYIINILSYNCFIKLYFKNITILRGILAFIKIKLKRTRFSTVISNKGLNIISIYYFKFIIIKGNKFLITSG